MPLKSLELSLSWYGINTSILLNVKIEIIKIEFILILGIDREKLENLIR